MAELQKRAGNAKTRVQMQLAMRKGDKSSTPLQYIYEAADCRIFYTHESFADPITIWKQVWDAYMQPENKCVKNSTGHKSGISGGFVPYGPWVLKNEDLPVPQEQGANGANEAANEKPPAMEYDGAGSRLDMSLVVLFVTIMAVMVQS